MKTIEISDADFVRLQDLAEPLIDTPASVIKKLLDHVAADGSAPSQSANSDGVFSFEAPPPLVHVKVISGRIGFDEPQKPTWDSLVTLCIGLMSARVGSAKNLGRHLGLNVVSGKKVDEGYKHIPELDVSYQGVSAQHAASAIGRAARALKVDANVDFVWRNKVGAHAPGKFASLSYTPN